MSMTEAKSNEQTPRFQLKGQFVKDLSFENPHAPNSLLKLDAKPDVNVTVTMKAQRLDEVHYEMVMNLNLSAKGEIGTLFLVELDYAGIVQLANIPEDKIEQLLFIDCAFLLFPFARRVIADITRDGGFQPVALEPIDFIGLYHFNKKAEQEAATATKN